MKSTPVKILRATNNEVTDATLHLDLPMNTLITVESVWKPVRDAALDRLTQSGHPVDDLPEHWHWDWGRKSRKLSLGYRCLGIECDGNFQSLMLVDLASKFAKLPPDQGKPLVYIDFLESAPWNVRPLTNAPLFKGIGAVMLRAAARLSVEEGFRGRIALHSLKKSEKLYRDCHLQPCGVDPSYEHLPYYELTAELFEKFEK